MGSRVGDSPLPRFKKRPQAATPNCFLAFVIPRRSKIIIIHCKKLF